MCGWILGDKLGWGWKEQLSLYLIPTVIYGWMFFGQKFPKSEASEKGLGLGEMFRDVGVLGALVVAYLLVLFFNTNLGMDKASAWMLGVLLVVVAGVMTRRQTEIPAQSWMLLMMCGLLAIFAQIAFNLPLLGTLIIAAALMVGMGVTMRWAMGAVLLFVLFITHALVGAVELGTDQWIQNITGNILSTEQGKILFVFTSMMMFGLRFCAGWIEEKLGLSPIGILFVCAVLACLGLNLASGIETFAGAFVALAIYGIGKTFFWPTMLAVASDRYPRTGAIAISIMGGIGMLSAGLIGSPGLGYSKDRFAGEALKAESEAVYAQYQNEGTSKFLFFSEARGLDAKKMGEVQDKLIAARKILPKDGYDDEKKRLEKEQKDNQAKLEKLKKEGEALGKISATIAEEQGDTKEWESAYEALKDRAASYKKDSEDNVKETKAAQEAVDGAKDGLKALDLLKATLEKAEVYKAEGNSNKKAALAALTPEERMAHRASIAGDRKTLVADSFIPAIMAVIYLLMMLYFKSIGGYKPVTIDRKVEE